MQNNVETQHKHMYSLYIGSLCNVAFPMARFTCIVTSQVFWKIWMWCSIALSSAFYRGRKHLWIVFSFNYISLFAAKTMIYCWSWLSFSCNIDSIDNDLLLKWTFICSIDNDLLLHIDNDLLLRLTISLFLHIRQWFTVQVDSLSLSSIDNDLLLKLTDNSLSRDLFPGDYHCLGDNENRPVKWLALEALVERRFSLASDAVRTLSPLVHSIISSQ